MNDLISRQAALEAVGDVHPLDYNGQAILHRIQQLPPIEPKRGKWIKEGVTCSLYQCSACKTCCTFAGWANCVPEEQMYKSFKFCPECGAQMESG